MTQVQVSLVTSEGNILYVGGNGSNNYSQIRDAIKDASDGDTIIIFPGNYLPIVVDKELSLIGVNKSGQDPPLIFGGQGSDCTVIQSDHCYLENLLMRNGDGGYLRRAMVIDSDFDIIVHCNLYETGVGIIFDSSSGDVIENTNFYSGRNGIIFDGVCANNRFEGNTIHGHSEHEIKGGFDNTLWINNTVQGCGTGDGFHVSGCRNCSFIHNTIGYNQGTGVEIASSHNISFINNSFIENGLSIDGDISCYATTLVVNNTVDGKPLYYYVNKENITVPDDAGQIMLVNCSHCLINRVNISKADTCVLLVQSSYIQIMHSNFSSGGYNEGVKLNNSNNNDIEYNTFSGHSSGIYLIKSNSNNIAYNVIQSCTSGIFFHHSDQGNTIRNNKIESCERGMNFFSSNNLTIENNSISHCSNSGIMLSSCANCKLKSNDFFSNKVGLDLDAYQAIINRNNFIGNVRGLVLQSRCGARITQNNFILNALSATFVYEIFQNNKNIWFHNYWGARHLIGPFLIKGILLIGYAGYFPVLVFLPWFNIDLSPEILPHPKSV